MITLNAVIESAHRVKDKYSVIQRLSPDFALPEDNIRTHLACFSKAYDKYSNLLKIYDRELKSEPDCDQFAEHLANQKSILNDTATVKHGVDEALRAKQAEEWSSALSKLSKAVKMVGETVV